MKICVCGGGALGHICSAVFSSVGKVHVNIYTQHPAKWGHTLKVKDILGKEYIGTIDVISDNPCDVICGCDMVFLCLPGFLIETTLRKIKPYLGINTIVGSIVSSTGFFFQAHRILSSTSKLFGFQRTPFIARVTEYGKSASLLGYKPQVSIALENIDDKRGFRLLTERLFMTPTDLLNNYYEASLTNSNPILHTGRLYTMWHKWDGIPFNRCSLFYKEWDVASSQTIIEMDKEFMSLLNKLPVDKRHIPSLLNYYDSVDAETLTNKLSSIPAFQSILSPMKEVEGGWIPDFGSRYFTEDFPYGLRFIKDLAVETQIDTPTIDRVYDWGMNVINSL